MRMQKGEKESERKRENGIVSNREKKKELKKEMNNTRRKI